MLRVAKPTSPMSVGTWVLTALGAALAGACGGRSRVAAISSGAALVAGSAFTRFAIFHAGQQSAVDPRYTVVPQRERLDQAREARNVGRPR